MRYQQIYDFLFCLDACQNNRIFNVICVTCLLPLLVRILNVIFRRSITFCFWCDNDTNSILPTCSKANPVNYENNRTFLNMSKINDYNMIYIYITNNVSITWSLFLIHAVNDLGIYHLWHQQQLPVNFYWRYWWSEMDTIEYN